MNDSGKREGFDSGSVRDSQDGKSRPALMSPFAAERLGLWLAKGAAKYAPRNWEKGQPFSRCVESLERHVMYYKQGRDDEDHLAAVMCNAMFMLHFEEGIRRGFLPAELDDMPHYMRGLPCPANPPVTLSACVASFAKRSSWRTILAAVMLRLCAWWKR